MNLSRQASKKAVAAEKHLLVTASKCLTRQHYKKITVLQRIFLLQIFCKPIKIRCKSILATDLQHNSYVAKNLVAILHTLAFGCK